MVNIVVHRFFPVQITVLVVSLGVDLQGPVKSKKYSICGQQNLAKKLRRVLYSFPEAQRYDTEN